MTCRAARSDTGFTLLEALIALTILSLTAVSLLGAGSDHIRRVSGIEDRTIAGLVAEMRMQEILLAPNRRNQLPREITAAGRLWRVQSEDMPTDDPELLQVVISVRLADANGPAVDRIGFADLGAPK